MTRTPHDQFAKQFLAELLAQEGEVQITREVTPEVRQVDIWFVPKFQPTAVEPQVLGLLAEMAAKPCQFEPFRNSPSSKEVRDCLLKLFSLHSEFQRQARREANSLSEDDLPRLWILSQSFSLTLISDFGAKLDEKGHWCQGIYFLPKALRTAFVAINQLPLDESTLWLRVLGRGSTQRQAVDEVNALPQNHPFRSSILEILSNWRINLQMSQNLSEEDRELLMNLSPAYLRWREDTLEQGRLEGRLESRQEFIENLLKVRFGEVDEPLSRAIAPLLELPPEELTRVLVTLSRKELLQQFGQE